MSVKDAANHKLVILMLKVVIHISDESDISGLPHWPAMLSDSYYMLLHCAVLSKSELASARLTNGE